MTPEAQAGPTVKLWWAEVGIYRAHGGGGMYDCTPPSDEPWFDVDALIARCAESAEHKEDMVELTDGAVLPGWAKDIRGRIYNQPKRVFAMRCSRDDWDDNNPEENVQYFGITPAPAPHGK